MGSDFGQMASYYIALGLRLSPSFSGYTLLYTYNTRGKGEKNVNFFFSLSFFNGTYATVRSILAADNAAMDFSSHLARYAAYEA